MANAFAWRGIGAITNEGQLVKSASVGTNASPGCISTDLVTQNAPALYTAAQAGKPVTVADAPWYISEFVGIDEPGTHVGIANHVYDNMTLYVAVSRRIDLIPMAQLISDQGYTRVDQLRLLVDGSTETYINGNANPPPSRPAFSANIGVTPVAANW